MDRVKIINHQGKKILYIDFNSLDSIELIGSILQEVKIYVHAQLPFSVYSLVNVEGMRFNNSVKEMFTEVVQSNKPFVKASAVIGVTGLIQIMFNGLMKMTGREVKSFSSMELAKNWLISQS